LARRAAEGDAGDRLARIASGAFFSVAIAAFREVLRGGSRFLFSV